MWFPLWVAQGIGIDMPKVMYIPMWLRRATIDTSHISHRACQTQIYSFEVWTHLNAFAVTWVQETGLVCCWLFYYVKFGDFVNAEKKFVGVTLLLVSSVCTKHDTTTAVLQACGFTRTRAVAQCAGEVGVWLERQLAAEMREEGLHSTSVLPKEQQAITAICTLQQPLRNNMEALHLNARVRNEHCVVMPHGLHRDLA